MWGRSEACRELALLVRALDTQILASLHCLAKVGDGRKIRFWQDKWVGHSPLKDLFPAIFNCSSNKGASISDLRVAQVWSIPFRRNLNDWEIEEYAPLLQLIHSSPPLTPKVDHYKWELHSKGIFSVRSCYSFLSEPSPSHTCWPWKTIWKSMAPQKVKCFMWLLTHGRCLTLDNLQKRGIQLCNRCTLCEEEAEDVNHLFLLCKVSCSIWNLVFNLLNINWCMPSSTVGFLLAWKRKGISKSLLNTWNSIPAAVCWVIWKERNARIFEDKKDTILNLKSKCIFLLSFWCKMAVANLLEPEAMLDFFRFLHDM